MNDLTRNTYVLLISNYDFGDISGVEAIVSDDLEKLKHRLITGYEESKSFITREYKTSDVISSCNLDDDGMSAYIKWNSIDDEDHNLDVDFSTFWTIIEGSII